MSRTVELIGVEAVQQAANTMRAAAQQMQAVADQLSHAFLIRRQWEEEYLQRIEAIVREELDTYRAEKGADIVSAGKD